MTKRIVIGSGLTAALLLTLFILPNLPDVLHVNIFLVAIILTLLFGETRLALGAAIAGGVIFDLVSSWAFGSWLLTLVFAMSMTRWVSRSRITNRSFIAYMALTVLAVAGAWIALYGFAHGLSLVDRNALAPIFGLPWVNGAGSEIIKAAVLASGVYLVVRLSGRNYATLADHEF